MYNYFLSRPLITEFHNYTSISMMEKVSQLIMVLRGDSETDVPDARNCRSLQHMRDLLLLLLPYT